MSSYKKKPKMVGPGRYKEKSVAVFNALYFGLMPWWIYENICHYKQPYIDENGNEKLEALSYFSHLTMNLKYAYSMLKEGFTEADLEFANSTVSYIRKLKK